MKKLIDVITKRFGTCYQAAKHSNSRQDQLIKLVKKDALVDETGQVWIKSKTVINK